VKNQRLWLPLASVATVWVLVTVTDQLVGVGMGTLLKL
jgi:hypothetical protein